MIYLLTRDIVVVSVANIDFLQPLSVAKHWVMTPLLALFPPLGRSSREKTNYIEQLF